jgi:type VI secretion system secreted protein VgrG
VNLDIRAGVIAATVLTMIFFLISITTGTQTVLASRKIKFFNLSQDQKRRGWWLILLAVFWAILGILVYFYGEPVAYTIISPSPTRPASLTPSISPSASVSPTITETPTITLTPAESYTPLPTSTPHIPVAVEARFEGKLTPPAQAAFSPLTFSNIGLDAEYNPIGPGIQFTNPVGHLYAVFSYALMEDDIQWSALWYRGDELVHYESLPWNGGSGGIGYTDWDPSPELWLPGEYQIQIFLGLDFYISGNFSVVGEPSRPAATLTPDVTSSPTFTIQPTVTVSPAP